MSKEIITKTENHEDALKYAYAFMKSDIINLKECSFPNPNPSKPKKGYIFPADMFLSSFTEKNLPSWEKFKVPPENQIPGFSCVGCVDKKDEKRVSCALFDKVIHFIWYGDYDTKAKAVFDDIVRIQKGM